MDEQLTSLLQQTLAERTEWDEHPELYVIIDIGGRLELETLVAPDSVIWAISGHPVHVLEISTLGMDDPVYLAAWESFTGRSRAELVPAEGFCGVALRYEAWGVKVDAATEPATRERLRRATVEHDIYLQPERVEQRQIMAATPDGTLYWAHQDRDGEPYMETYAQPPEGRVPVAVAALASAMEKLARS